jgi:hypothetical protein
MPLLRGAVLLALLAIVGCGREVPVVAPEEEPTRLGETTDVDVAAWLKLPRAELAKLSEQWAAAVKHGREAARNAPDAIELLPHLYPPVRVPVFQEAAFSPTLGFSIPSYVTDQSSNGAVALHLARLGDHETAVKLAPPGDKALRSRIDSARYEQSYPLEWSRLVGLVIASSQLKVAGGDVDAATRLVLVHRQLRSVLDKKAAAGPLGSVLLPTGRRALGLAAKAWRDPKVNKIALAEDIEKALQEWGPAPEPMPGLVPGAAKDAVAEVLGQPITGKAVVLQKPEAMARAIDLLALPLPIEALEVIGVFLDAQDRLTEVQFTYRSKLETVYPEPANLAYLLDEHGLPVTEESRGAALFHETRVGAKLTFEAVRTNNSNALGGWVRVRSAVDPRSSAASRSLRDFGVIHLDRGFEANRVSLVPRKAGPAITVTDKTALAQLVAGWTLPAPLSAEMRREPDHDLLARARLSWRVDDNAHALSRLVPGLWTAFGNARVAAGEEATSGYLGFTWQDDQTRIQLRLPCDEKAPVLVIEDTRGKDRLADRAAAARKQDARDRQARLAANKPALRLPRSPGDVNGLSLEGLRLGQPKAEAEAALPTGPNYPRKDFTGGVSVIVRKSPVKGVPFWARQIILRYNARDQLAEVRVRYEEELAPTPKGESLLEKLSDTKAGAPETVPASWLGLWSDLPRSRGKAGEVRWQDDLTTRTYKRDTGGAEVILTDRGSEDAGKPLGLLAFITPGLSGCRLGDTKEAVVAALKAPVTKSGSADVYRLPPRSPYEMALVWYRDGKVVRIIAVDRTRPASDDRGIAAALSGAWGRNLDELGFIRRQEGARGDVAGSYFWHDDVTRVQAFVQTADDGARLMTEWRAWPLAGVKAPN